MLGVLRWSWDFVLPLIPILLFHELGHYLSMKWFKYRNLKMFFIPLLGAAVSGKHFNTPGWKKVIVSLMGPVPGILLGGALGIAGIAWNQTWLVDAAVLMVIINGFNLLPILPLDGGWVVHSILFCRHYLWDAGFRIIAACALIAISFSLDAYFLMFLGVFMLMSVSASYRNSKIIHELKQSGVATVSPDDQRIPIATANQIINRVKAAFPEQTPVKLIAQRTLSIFESLNAKPPGWPASSFFLIIHGGSFILAIFLILILSDSSGGRLQNLLSRLHEAPLYRFSSGENDLRIGPQFSSEISRDQVVLVASFDDSSTARIAFEQIAPEISPESAIRLFGQSVFLSLPELDEELQSSWFSNLEEQTKALFFFDSEIHEIFISGKFSQSRIASYVEALISDYLLFPNSETLTPPWSPIDTRTEIEKSAHDKARKTYLKLTSTENAFLIDDEYLSLIESLSSVQDGPNEEEIEGLRTAIQELRETYYDDYLSELILEEGSNLDSEIVNIYMQMQSEGIEDEEWEALHQQLQVRFGQIPLSESEPGDANGRFSAYFGFSYQEDKSIEIDCWNSKTFSLDYPRLPSGLPNRVVRISPTASIHPKIPSIKNTFLSVK